MHGTEFGDGLGAVLSRVGPSLTMIRATPTYQQPHETVGRDQATPFSAWDHLSC